MRDYKRIRAYEPLPVFFTLLGVTTISVMCVYFGFYVPGFLLLTFILSLYIFDVDKSKPEESKKFEKRFNVKRKLV